jgi:hypothetical protein
MLTNYCLIFIIVQFLEYVCELVNINIFNLL